MWALGAVMGVSAIMGYTANRRAGRENKQAAELNARIAKIQARQSIALAEEDVIRMRDDETRLVADQEASYAGQGVDLSSDIVDKTTAQTQLVMEQEIAVVRNNARTRAWGLEVQAQQDITAGQVARRRGNSAAIQSILGGATNIAVAKAGYDAGTLA